MTPISTCPRSRSRCSTATLLNNGQTCFLCTRVLAPRSRYGEIVDIFSGLAGALKVGDPLDPSTQIGPMVSERQRRARRGLHRQGQERGSAHHRRRWSARRGWTRAGSSSRPSSRTWTTARHRPGGDLRTGTVRHPLQRRRRGGQHRERLRLRPRRNRLDHATTVAAWRLPSGCRPDRSGSTTTSRTRPHRSAGSSPAAWDVSSAPRDWPRT